MADWARLGRLETLFLLLNTRAILIAYLNMKFVRLARTGMLGWKTLNTNSDT